MEQATVPNWNTEVNAVSMKLLSIEYFLKQLRRLTYYY